MSPNMVAILRTLHLVMVDPLRVEPMPMMHCTDTTMHELPQREDHASKLPAAAGPTMNR